MLNIFSTQGTHTHHTHIFLSTGRFHSSTFFHRRNPHPPHPLIFIDRVSSNQLFFHRRNPHPPFLLQQGTLHKPHLPIFINRVFSNLNFFPTEETHTHQFCIKRGLFKLFPHIRNPHPPHPPIFLSTGRFHSSTFFSTDGTNTHHTHRWRLSGRHEFYFLWRRHDDQHGDY